MNKTWSLLRKHPAVRAARYEAGLYRDLVWWLCGKTVVPGGAQVLPHQPGRLQLVGMFTVVLLVELVVVHLLLPDGALQILALVLSVWGVLFVWALVASERVRPSYIDADRLVLRRGHKVFAEIPRQIIHTHRHATGYATDTAVADGELVIGGPAGTDTLLILRSPVLATEDTYPWQKKRTQPVSRVRFYSGGISTSYR